LSRDLLDAELVESASYLGWRLLSGKFFGHRPMGIIALKDAVTVAIEAKGRAVASDQLLKSTELSNGVFRFQLEVCGQHPAGGVVLKAD
jgi:hypothetical protein